MADDLSKLLIWLGNMGRHCRASQDPRGSGNRNVVPGPSAQHKDLIFFGEFKNVGAVRAVWKELGFGLGGFIGASRHAPTGAQRVARHCAKRRGGG